MNSEAIDVEYLKLNSVPFQALDMEEFLEDDSYEPNEDNTVVESLEEEQEAVETILGSGDPRFINEFLICKMLFRHQQCEPSVDFATIRSNSLEEFMDNLYQLVQPFIKREIEFYEMNQPSWAEKEFPTREDLTRFVAFKDKVRKRSYRIEQVTEFMLKRWNEREIILQVYTYSSNLDSRAAWDIARQVLLGEEGPTDDGIKKVIKAAPDNDENRLKAITRKLQKIHQAHLKPKTDDAFQQWAQLVMQQSSKKYKDFGFGRLPKKLQNKFTVMKRLRERKSNSIWGPALPGHSADGYGFEEEVYALRQTVIQIKDLVEMLDRRVEMLEEKCQGFRQTRNGVALKKNEKYDSDGAEESEDGGGNDDAQMGEENEEPAINVAAMVQVDLEQPGGSQSGHPDPLFPMEYEVKEENDEVESDE